MGFCPTFSLKLSEKWECLGIVSAKGLEPLTNGLKGHCSTIELRARSKRHFIMALSGRQPMILMPMARISAPELDVL